MRCAKLRDKIGKKVRGKKGRYKIIESLTKKGGMGVLFVAETTDKPKTKVVIKFAQGDQINLVKLHLEAEFLQAFQKSKPEGIVPYVDEADEKEEEFFLVIEKLKGKDLEAKIGSKKLDEETVVKFSNDIAKALRYLHDCRDLPGRYGVIHRDIDPKNIIAVEKNGEEHCILIDFGAATDIKDVNSKIGKEGWSCWHAMLPPYNVRAECDIYALGRTMWYMATGVLPSKYEKSHPNFGNMEYTAEQLFGVSPELSNLINDMINYPDHSKVQTAGDVIQRLSLLRTSTRQAPRVQSRKHTVQPQQQQILQGPHIILGGKRYPIDPITNRCEIGQSHNCDPNFDCSRGVIHDGMDGFDYPHKPDIEIPLIGSPPESVAAAHHMRIWKDDGQWYVRDLDTTNWSAILKNQQWILLNDGHKGKTMTLDENFTKLAIGYRSGGRTEIEFSFYKQ